MQSVGLCGVGPRRLFDCLRWPDQDRHHHVAKPTTMATIIAAIFTAAPGSRLRTDTRRMRALLGCTSWHRFLIEDGWGKKTATERW